VAEDLVRSASATDLRARSAASAAEASRQAVTGASDQTDELAEAATLIGQQVAESNRSAAAARTGVNDTRTSIDGLITAAERVGDVIKLIRSVAEQTNLLALNAAIEAARAGEAGKGFAVVAAEVKDLARQTRGATTDVERQIDAIRAAADDVRRSLDTMDTAVGQMGATAASVADVVVRHERSTASMRDVLSQVAQGAQDVASGVSDVGLAAQETRNASGALLGAAGELSEVAERLRADVTALVKELSS
jgi:methyl-accepting chemotaxis protein